MQPIFGLTEIPLQRWLVAPPTHASAGKAQRVPTQMRRRPTLAHVGVAMSYVQQRLDCFVMLQKMNVVPPFLNLKSQQELDAT